MYSQKIIWSWVLFIVALLVHGILESYELKMMSLLLFGGIIGILRKDIERDRFDGRSFSYFWDLSSITRTVIVSYFLVISILLLWLGFNQPGTLDDLFYGDNGLIMLFLVLSPLWAPLFLSVIRCDIKVIRDERT
jgi:hypothetical protein